MVKKGHCMHDKYAALVNSNTATTVSNNNNKTGYLKNSLDHDHIILHSDKNC